jgi:hypothetical protein
MMLTLEMAAAVFVQTLRELGAPKDVLEVAERVEAQVGKQDKELPLEDRRH